MEKMAKAEYDCHVMLKIQLIDFQTKRMERDQGIVFFNDGAMQGLIREEMAKKLGLIGKSTTQAVWSATNCLET